jgi:glucose/mannose transport system substrate-binding protein
MDQFTSDTIVGSLTHGAVANDNWKSEIDTALGLFLTNKDQAAFQKALAAACSDAGTCS